MRAIKRESVLLGYESTFGMTSIVIDHWSLSNFFSSLSDGEKADFVHAVDNQ